MRLRSIAKVASRALEVRVRNVLGLRLRPYKALLELTSACNSRCTTCDIWRTPASVRKHDLTFPEIENVLAGFSGDLVWLALSGGEVTLVEHFPHVIEAAKRHCANLAVVTFTTNGLLPEKALAFARCVSDHGFDLFVTVSLDGDESAHDRIRGVQGNHALAVRTLELLRAAGIPAHFGLTLSDANRQAVREGLGGRSADVKAVTFVESGGIYRKQNPADDQSIVDSLRDILKDYPITGPGELIEWVYLRLAIRFFGTRRRRLPIPCDVLRTSVHVRPNGDVLPCMFLPAIGNTRNEPFSRILKSADASRALRRIDNEDCPRCWMNCYAPHSILSRPLRAILRALAPMPTRG